MKVISASGLEGVEICLPNGRVETVVSCATCHGAIESHCLYWYEYEPIGAYLINEKGIVFSNCTLRECEGDLYLVCRRKLKPSK